MLAITDLLTYKKCYFFYIGNFFLNYLHIIVLARKGTTKVIEAYAILQFNYYQKIVTYSAILKNKNAYT
jgi:hypothetical protein